jgi:hypothetical protein
LRAQFEQEVAVLKQQLAEDIAEVCKEQSKSSEEAMLSSKPHRGQPAQKEYLERELADLKEQFAQEKAKTEDAIQTLWRHFLPRKQFAPRLFSSNALSGVHAHLTEKCCGNVHDKGSVEIAASSVSGEHADLGEKDSYFCSQGGPDEWISCDFKALRIEPTHYAIRTWEMGPNYGHLKNWAVEGSDDGAMWTEIDRRENNNDLNDKATVKTFAVVRSGSFRRIRLRQTGPNHRGNNYLFLSAFEIFGAIAGLQ